MAKKSTKKPAAKTTKATPRKKTKGRASKKKAATRKKKQPAAVEPTPLAHRSDRPETQLEVWEAYTRLRSVNAVCRETGIGKACVRAVLAQDSGRVLRIADEFLESYAAQLEACGERAIGVVHKTLDHIESFLRELQKAAEEGRVTTIRGEDGKPLPVLDVISFLQNARLLDQAARIAEKTWALSKDYRVVQQPATREREASTQSALDMFTWTDEKFAQVLRESGRELPPALERKVKRIESRSSPTPQKTTDGEA